MRGWARCRSEGVDLELWIGSRPTIPPSSNVGTGPRPTGLGTIRAHGLALTDNARGNARMDGVILVPDGVARITLHPTRLNDDPVNIDPSQFGTATATVHDNVAAFQLPIPTATTSRSAVSGLLGASAVAQTTWLDASGHVIKHTNHLRSLHQDQGKERTAWSIARSTTPKPVLPAKPERLLTPLMSQSRLCTIRATGALRRLLQI